MKPMLHSYELLLNLRLAMSKNNGTKTDVLVNTRNVKRVKSNPERLR